MESKILYDFVEKISLHCYGESPLNVRKAKSNNNFVFFLKFKGSEKVLKIDKDHEGWTRESR